MADLFTVSELASYLQRDLDTSSATLAKDSAQAIVRAYTQQQFSSTTYTSKVLPIVAMGAGYGVLLPQRPVTAVSSVVVNGSTYVLGTGYAWNGLSPWIKLADLTYSSAAFQDDPVAVVTYTAGYATIPADVKAVALAVAGRQYDNPQGLRSQAIDDYSITRAGADEDLAGVALLKSEERILDRYRVRATSVVPR